MKLTKDAHELRQLMDAAPLGSLFWRNVGSGAVEVLSIVDGSVTRLGTTKDAELIAFIDIRSKQA